MSFSTPELTLGQTLEFARELGYHGIEPRTGRSHCHGIELSLTARERGEIRRQVDASGVTLCCLATGLRLAAPPDLHATLEDARRHIGLAHELGCERLRVFGGTLPPELSRPAAVDMLSRNLASLADEAAAAGVRLALETHDAWCHPGHVAAVMQQVAHPAVGVTWDMMHPQRTAGVPVSETFALLAPWICHTHIHDGTMADPLEIRPCGEGELDLQSFFVALRSSGYDGFISGEWPDCEGVIDLKKELQTLKEMTL